MTQGGTQTDSSDETPLARFVARESLPPEFQRQVDRFYRPLADAIVSRQGTVAGAVVVGLCGPQGSGKSTGAWVLAQLLNGRGVRTAVLSLDNLYLTRAERAALARTTHPLLMTRGPPGTHDTNLGHRLLRDLMRQASTQMPSFDKASDDRAPPSQWSAVAGPAEVILFEGWCVGARPQSPDALKKPINTLEETRAALQGDPPASILTDDQVGDFIQHYERISRHIDAEMPSRADIVISLDDQRRPIEVTRR
jgi:D-glycerate 3-kinase